MKLQLQFALIYLISLILVVLCDELSNTSTPVNWICACSSDEWDQSNISQSNCFNSCRCQADEANGHHWYCVCNEGAFPKITPQSGDGTCFAACNCTSGSLNEVQVSGVKHTSSSKIVVIVLLLCVILTTIALVSSIAWYFHQKGNYPINASSSLSSEESLSYNSATNLIIDRSLVTQTKLNISSPIPPSTGCFQNAYFIFKSKPKTIRGTICQFSFSELESATDLFSNSTLIGLGGSSCVYRGRLRDGRTAAIKRLKDHGDPEADHLFSTEVDLLSRLNHCHVVPMLGYCSEFQGRHVERLLVFEYIPNGNLRECLDGSLGETLIWETRVSIAIGAARGLEYLHEAVAPRILHRDVKSTNILLDENWRAKITDLGMAKYLKSDGFASISSSPARMQGTFGYFAPEYAIVGKGSLKSDVFSFGVVLLELITGRQPIQKASREGEESLVIWAATRLQDSRRVISELPDPRLKGKFPAEEMQIMAYLAKECLLLDPDARPTMTEVLQILSSIASDKCRMRNIHAGLYQWSSIHLSRAETNSSGLDDVQVKHPIEEPRMFEEEEEEVSPVEEDGRLCSEKTILLLSNARSCRSQEEETVDLVEPRLESFCMENVK